MSPHEIVSVLVFIAETSEPVNVGVLTTKFCDSVTRSTFTVPQDIVAGYFPSAEEGAV